MTTRITRKDAERTLKRYCELAGVPFGHYVTVGPDSPPPVQARADRLRPYLRELSRHEDGRVTYVVEGGYALDVAYGGYEVTRIDGSDNGWQGRPGTPCTGVSTPFGAGHYPARVIVDKLQGAIAALDIARGTR